MFVAIFPLGHDPDRVAIEICVQILQFRLGSATNAAYAQRLRQSNEYLIIRFGF